MSARFGFNGWIKGRRAGAVARHACLGAALAFVLSAGVPGALAADEAPVADTAPVESSLLQDALDHPSATFDVIVQSEPGSTEAADATTAAGGEVERSFDLIGGVQAQLTGEQVTNLAETDGVAAITYDRPVQPSGKVSNVQPWPQITDTSGFWTAGIVSPTIAVIDSGIDARPTDFGSRVTKQVSFVSDGPNTFPGDGYGHGTLVASIAAGKGPYHLGVATNAHLVSLDVFDDNGAGTVGDVIAAIDWVYNNRAANNIRVVNLSLTSSVPSSFTTDPLARAVEKLWLSGIVVVAAAGNYGAGDVPSGVQYAPGNDPFVITVGASDTMGTNWTGDDVAAPWSAWGSTPDGFAKPDLGAPGRKIIGYVPPSSMLSLMAPSEHHFPNDPYYMWMSGTSFATPMVAGAAAYVLAANPEWTPDQVKGALMLTAAPTAGPMGSLGVGSVRGAAASRVTDPPNPNLGLDQFLIDDPDGGPTKVFDAASWWDRATNDPAWNEASWSSASWSSASWSSASWSSASWSSASWSSASWSSGLPPTTEPAAFSNIWDF